MPIDNDINFWKEFLPWSSIKILATSSSKTLAVSLTIQILILSACMNRFAATVYGHTAVGVMLFGIMMQDYSIDYEEYYNRQMVWCVSSGWNLLVGPDFRRNVWFSWYCSEFTAYWNNNSTGRLRKRVLISTGWRDVYYCSSEESQTSQALGNVRVVVRWTNLCGRHGSQQSFGQYAALFTDVRWWDWGGWDIVWTSDDEELWRIMNGNVRAIEDANNIQEIYLISHDGKNRLYFRRKLVNQWWEFLQYKIQMLRLKWFDAWQKHNFSLTTDNDWLYDWVIDTWACDSSMWFVWHWQGLSGAYAEYFLPSDVDDCWIDLTQWATNVHAWNISMSPLGDPDLFWAADERQINPSMKIMMVSGIYPVVYGTGYFSSSIGNFQVPLWTTINMKDFYEEV